MVNAVMPARVMEQLCPIMCEAGHVALSFQGKKLALEYKDDSSIVTEADKAVEAFLIERLSTIVPNARFVAEESGERGAGE